MRALGLLFAVLMGLSACADAADWPTWRHDANRSAATDEELTPQLHLQWVRQYPPIRATWPDERRVRFDAAHEPVVSGKTVFVCLPESDKLVALDATTGEEKWRFFADGPMRYAPLVWKGGVLVGSDDGHLYCLDGATGQVRWKFRGGPADNKVLGHGRLISAWPVSAGPVLADGKVYFTAGIWPFMGVFVHALDAETGEVVWTNDGTSFLRRAMPAGHTSAVAFSGPTPLGYMVAAGDRLLIPCGRSLPACFDRISGKLLYYKPTAAGFTDSLVTALGDYFFSGKHVLEISTGKRLREMPRVNILTEEAIFAGAGAYDPRKSEVTEYTTWRGQKATKVTVPKLYDVPAADVRIKAGSRLYLASAARIVAVELPRAGERAKVSWSAPVEGTIGSIVAADGKLFVATAEGRLLCFGPEKVEPKTLADAPQDLPADADIWTTEATDILKRTGVNEGYCLVLGVGTGRLATELVRQSNLHVVAVDSDPAKVDALRREFDAGGLYGRRVSALAGDPLSLGLPPFVAGLIVSEDLDGAGFASGSTLVKTVFRSLRPYGGVACLHVPTAAHASFSGWVKEAALSNAEVTRSEPLTILRRVGALPGAGEWTHDNADAGRTLCSQDSVTRGPLGVLWFGGPAGGDLFINSGWRGGPSPLVVGGRMILQGRRPEELFAIDVYTGRILWKAAVGPAPEGNTPATRLAGAWYRRYFANWAAARDGVYLAHGETCIVIDPATGKTVSEWKLARPREAAGPSHWGNLLVLDDALIAASCRPVDPAKLPTDQKELTSRQIVRLCEWLDAVSNPRNSALQRGTDEKETDFAHENLGKLLGPKPLAAKFPMLEKRPIFASMETAERLVVLDRQSGKPLWTYPFAYGCPHNSGLVAGRGKIFCLDAYPQTTAEVLKRRGRLPADYQPRLIALDARKGTVLWSAHNDVEGDGGLSYAAARDVLLQAGGRASKLKVARRGDDGKVLWKKRLPGEHWRTVDPSIIRNDAIITYEGQAYDLMTGERKTVTHPLTGAEVPLTVFVKSYGCNHPVASGNPVTVRSGNPAFIDLTDFCGVHSLGGFRSGCQNSLIVADGVLTSPRYTSCGCAYPVFTSLGLVHTPELELWGSFGRMPVTGRVKRVGLNLGAPGDRRAADGTLWLDYPSVGGPSPDIPVTVTPEAVEWFQHHSSLMVGEGLRWVGASGCMGLRKLTLTLAPKDAREATYRVRLHFAEVQPVKPGERLFTVAVQGKTVAAVLDVVKEAGGLNRVLVKEFSDVRVGSDLTVQFVPVTAKPAILSGIEVIRQ